MAHRFVLTVLCGVICIAEYDVPILFILLSIEVHLGINRVAIVDVLLVKARLFSDSLIFLLLLLLLLSKWDRVST